MNKKTIGIILMWVGFLAASFFVMQQLKTVNWLAYAITAAVSAFGVILIRSSDSGAATEVAKVDTDLNIMESSLRRVLDNLGQMISNKDEIFVYDVHGKIDADLSTDMFDFAEARESIMHGIGMHEYAMVMDNFARGERSVNRAWSASADGYVDEVWVCLEKGRTYLAEADRLLNSYIGAKA